MISLERSVLFLIVYLTIFFNVERVDLGQTNLIDIASVSYVMVLIALILILSIPNSARLNLPILLIGWVIFYLGVRFTILPLYKRAIWGGIYTYLTITEISLSSIAIILGYQVRRNLNDFRQAVENLTLSGLTPRIQHKTEANEDIQKEFLRSRRHHYRLSIMVIEPDPSTVKIGLNRAVLEIQKAMMTRYAITNIMRLASHMVRRTDLIIDQVIDKDSFVILLTDTDSENANKLAVRFQGIVEKAMGVKINFGLSSFPDDGLTFEDLVKKADESIAESPADAAAKEHSLDQPSSRGE